MLLTSEREMSLLRAHFAELSKWAAVITIAAALKWFYSQANVNELRWILAPTKILVEWVTWSAFTFEPWVGYMNREHTFLIAAPCSGVNFLIIAFLMLALQALWNAWPDPAKWASILKSGLLAYTATIVANTIRISLALQTQDQFAAVDWLDAKEMHRLQGIIVYFGSLLVLFLLTDDARGRVHAYPKRPRGVLRRSIWPLSIYYCVTLGIPLINSSFDPGSLFWRHSLVVLLTPLALVAILSAFRLLKASTFSRNSTL